MKKIIFNSVWRGRYLGYFTNQENIKENNILTTRESSHTYIIEHCFGLLFTELGKKCKRETNVPSGVMMGRYDLTKRGVQRLLPAGHGERRTCCVHSSLWQILPQSHKREQVKVIRFIFPFLAKQIWVDGAYGRYSCLLHR